MHSEMYKETMLGKETPCDSEDSGELTEESSMQGDRSCCHITTIVILTLLLCAVTLAASYVLLQLKAASDANTRLERENSRFRELFSSDNLAFLWRFCDTRTLECALCPPGWLQFGQRCFFLSGETKTWEEARRICFGFGGDLAVVWNEEDQVFLTNMTVQYRARQGHFQSAWIGLQDLVEEGNFLWVDGHGISSDVEYWRPLNPNNVIAYWDKETMAGQDCVAIVPPQNLTEKNWFNSWDDVTCRAIRNFLCETKVFRLLPGDIPVT